MCLRLALLVFLYKIPPSLVNSMDETFFFLAPLGGSTTMEVRCSRGRVVW